jgi:4-aminobutyrate--pyruvate transaminase
MDAARDRLLESRIDPGFATEGPRPMTQSPNSTAARDIAYVVHPYTNLRKHEKDGPLVITHGEGVWVVDDDGKRYLEGLAGLWCTALGWSEKRLVEAAARQMATMPYMHVFAHRSTMPVIELAERVLSMTPGSLKKAFWVNSGSEAIDTAIKLIWYYQNARGKPEKKIIIGRKRAYHGITLAGGHLTALAYARDGFDLPMADRFRQLTCPSFYRDGKPGETEEQFSDRLAQELEDLILAEGPDRVAAFFAEPVQGAGGVIVPPVGYFQKIQPILKKYDVLFVADEVINGFWRTGKAFGSLTFGIEPDMMTIAKQLSSAYLPIAGLLMSDPIYQTLADRSVEFNTLGMGYTYGGHPVSAAVALETLKIYEERRIGEHVAEVAPHFQKRLKQMEQHPLVGEARGIGLIGAVELVKDKATREMFDPKLRVGMMAANHCLPFGLILRGLPFDAVGICPPLIITEQEIDILFDRLWQGLDATAAALLPKAA